MQSNELLQLTKTVKPLKNTVKDRIRPLGNIFKIYEKMFQGKKFTLLTEYNQVELQTLIEQSIRKIVQEEMTSIVSNLNQNTRKKPDTLLSRRDLKKILRLSYPTISKLTKDGVLNGKIVGGSYRYKESEINNFLSQKN